MGAVAMANKFYNPAIPEVLKDFTRYTMNSQFMDGMTTMFGTTIPVSELTKWLYTTTRSGSRLTSS